MDLFVAELSFFVNTCICEYGAKCKFYHPKDKGGYPKISEQKGDGDSSIMEGIYDQVVSIVINGKTENKVTAKNPSTLHNSKGLTLSLLSVYLDLFIYLCVDNRIYH